MMEVIVKLHSIDDTRYRMYKLYLVSCILGEMWENINDQHL